MNMAMKVVLWEGSWNAAAMLVHHTTQSAPVQKLQIFCCERHTAQQRRHRDRRNTTVTHPLHVSTCLSLYQLGAVSSKRRGNSMCTSARWSEVNALCQNKHIHISGMYSSHFAHEIEMMKTNASSGFDVSM
jgi:hypothetical protein